MEKINRIKEVLKDEGRTAKWLAQKLEVDVATMSRWCNNHIQPNLSTLRKIAMILDVNVQEFLVKTK
ncbi:MAG: helix-turn-helix transcriptional regulator [Rikenellaceae bacterium]